MLTWIITLTVPLAVLAAAVLVLLLDLALAASGRSLGWLTAILLIGVLVASCLVDTSGISPHGVYVSNAWVLYFQRLFLIGGALSVLGSIDWLEKRAARRQAEYYALLLFSMVGMTLLPGARDWVLLVMAFELMGIPLYVLSAWEKGEGQGERLAAEAGLKLFATGAASSGFTLFGLALLTGMSGTTAISTGARVELQPLAALGLMFVLAGLAFKVGAVPFHFWIADTYQGAPTPFVAFLSVAPKAGGLAALSIVLLGGSGQASPVWLPALLFLAAASMVVGNIFALPQSDVRRLLGFSGIAQIGYALLALTTHSERGVAVMLFFIGSYLFTNLGVFFAVYAAAEGAGSHQLVQLAGLYRRAPRLCAALVAFLLSLAGIPFVVGFWAKLFLFLAAWQAGLVGMVALGVALAVVGLFYYLQVARSTFMAEGKSGAPLHIPFALGVTIAACMLAVVSFGLWPQALLGPAQAAAHAFWTR